MPPPTNKTPQPDGAAHLLGHQSPLPASPTPEFTKLPGPRKRCPFTGASRTWLLDHAKAGNIRVVRVCQPGRTRGAIFVYLPSVLDFLRREMAAQGGGTGNGAAETGNGEGAA